MTKAASAVAFLLLVVAAVPAFAHAGHTHTYMGTVTALHGDHAFVIRTTDGKDVAVGVSPQTSFAHTDGHPAHMGDVAKGERVVVKMATDGKTAATVKIGAKR